MKQSAFLLISLLSLCAFSSKGQQADSLLRNFEDSDSLLSLEDSLSIFNLIDSLLQLKDIENKSMVAVRMGYNSNANSSARTLGISQFGLSPGVSYYHKSGAYIDASGYWSSEFDPSYYLTLLSAGYIGVISPKWSFLGEYSRYLYSNLGEGVTVSYTNSASLSNFIDVKPLTFRLDYTFLFGDKTGHRVMPGVMLNLEKKNWRKINRILFYPSFNLLLGSEQYDELVPYAKTLAGAVLRIRKGLPLYYTNQGADFGIMNYSFMAPLSTTIRDWNFLLSYTYNIPKLLTHEEDASLTNSGFISASISRYIRFQTKPTQR